MLWCGVACAQTPVYPGAIATDSQLKIGVNGVATLLTAQINANQTTIPVSACARIVANVLITIDNEIMPVTGCVGTIMTVGARGFDSTTATAHRQNTQINAYVDAWHHNALSQEVQAIETALGPNLAHVNSFSSTFLLDSSYTTFALACAAAVAASETLVISKQWPLLTTQSCNAHLVFVASGSLQPNNGQTITIGQPVACTAGQTCFDTNQGGAFAFTATTSQIQASAFGASWSAGSTLALTNSQSIAGVSPLSHTTVLNYSGSGNAIGNAASSSDITIKDFSIHSTTAANGIALNGAVGLNVTNTEISGIDFNPTNTFSTFTNACILLQDTFLVHVFHSSCGLGGTITPYGIDLSVTGGFNDTNIISNNNIAGTTQAGIHCKDSCTGITIRDNVIESNNRKAIWLDTGNPVAHVDISSNHFENNSLTTPDYDVFIAPQGAEPTSYNGNWGPLIVNNNDSNDLARLGILYASDVRGLSVTNNQCEGDHNPYIVLGPAVINAYVANNKNCAVVGATLLPINDSTSQLTFENLFKYSVDLLNAAWSYSIPAGGAINRAGSPTFEDGTPAWNLVLGAAVSSNAFAVGQAYTTAPAGRLFSAGVWAKTTGGTAVAFAAIGDAYAQYTGTTVPWPVTIESTKWQWISVSTTTSAADFSSSITGSFGFYPLSGATTILIAKPTFCADTFNCAYVSTTSVPILKSSSPTGHTVAAALGTAGPASQPVYCDDCTLTNPPITAHSGAGGFLAIPVLSRTGTWTWSVQGAPNFVLDTTGAATFAVGTFPGATCGLDDFPPDGLEVQVMLHSALNAASANFFNLSACASGAANLPIVSSRDLNNIVTGYAAGGVISMRFNRALGPFGKWLDLSQ